MRKFTLLAVSLTAATATAGAAIPPPPQPRLVVAISVDQLSSELFEQYRGSFSGGFARMQSGIGFINGYQSHAATETCPGHSNLLTGVHPATSGIIANGWIDQQAARADKTIYCAEDERVAGSTYRNYTVSPEHLRAATLGDRMKAYMPASRNIAVAGKDRAAVMMSGRAVDQRWYWSEDRFVTDLARAPVPRTVAAANAAIAARVALPGAPLEPPPLCMDRAKPYVLTPTLTVGAGRLDRAAGDKRAFRAHPDLDGATLALAAGLVLELGLGRGPAATDVLSIGLSATDFVGHTFGNGGQEMCLHLLALDRELGDFFDILDRTGVDYAVVLTADHGAMDVAERLRDRGNAAATRADKALNSTAVGKAIAARLGLAGPVLLGDATSGDIWVDRALGGRERAAALAAARDVYRAHPQVAAVFTKDELAAAPKPSGDPRAWDLKARARASFDPTRSGDLVVLLKEFVSPIAEPGPGYAAGHGTPWDYDRRVPVLFWRRGMPASARPDPVEVVDILPTLAALIALPVAPGSVEGKCLAAVSGQSCP